MDRRRFFRNTGFPYQLILLAGLVGVGLGLLIGIVAGFEGRGLFVAVVVGALATQLVWEFVWVRRRGQQTTAADSSTRYSLKP